MITHHFPVVLTASGIAGNDEEVVGDNVAVVNHMSRELLTSRDIAPNALRSYFVDFYLTHALDGGFAQFVFMTPDRDEMDVYVREGLAAMGATKHLELFNRTAALFDRLAEDEMDGFLAEQDPVIAADADADAEATNVDGVGSASRPAGVLALEELDAEFEDLFEVEDVTGLNAAWLRAQPGLLILAEFEVAAHIADRIAHRIAHIPNVAERRAQGR